MVSTCNGSRAISNSTTAFYGPKDLKGGEYHMAQDVLCEVNNCHYWEEGNLCSADKIYVVSHQGDQASNVHETDCKTFEKVE